MRFHALNLLLVILTLSHNSFAASVYAGQARAAAVCSNCHGIRLPAEGAPFPQLAGQDQKYLETALKQYRDGTRKSDIMNAIAGSLTDTDINSVAGYYSKLKP